MESAGRTTRGPSIAKPTFFFNSDYGSTIFLALRLKRDGWPVLVYISDPHSQDVGRGIVPKTTNPVPPKDAIVVFDTVGHGQVGKTLRNTGHFVIGGNPFDKSLEADRPEGAKIMRDNGIRTPESKEFRSIPLAIKYLNGQEGAWFVKAIGADTPEAGTYDANTPERMIRYLRWLEGKLDHFQLSKRIKGIEVSVNGWFNGDEFMRPFEVTLEEKRFLAGNLGPRTGCESNVVYMCQDDKLAQETVLKIEDGLREERYVGPIDLNVLIGTDGHATGLEWTARLGFDATQAWSLLFDDTLGEQLLSYVQGGLTHWTASPDLAATLRVTMPPYPLWEPRVAEKYKGTPLDSRWLTDPTLFPSDVMLAPDGPVAAGRDGEIGEVSALGTSVQAVVKALGERAKDIDVPNKQYRIDPLSRVERDLGRLEELGLAGRTARRQQLRSEAP